MATGRRRLVSEFDTSEWRGRVVTAHATFQEPHRTAMFEPGVEIQGINGLKVSPAVPDLVILCPCFNAAH